MKKKIYIYKVIKIIPIIFILSLLFFLPIVTANNNSQEQNNESSKGFIQAITFPIFLYMILLAFGVYSTTKKFDNITFILINSFGLFINIYLLYNTPLLLEEFKLILYLSLLVFIFGINNNIKQ